MMQTESEDGQMDATTVIDTGLVDELVGLATSLTSMFTVFPINVFLIASLIGVGFGIFRKAKETVI